MMRIRGSNIAVIPIKDPDKSEGGIWIPDEAQERTDQGLVKYVGPKCKDVKVGDYVLFSGYSGLTVQFERGGDGTLILLDEKAIVSILDNPDTEVSGLYFRGKRSQEATEDLKDKLWKLMEEWRQQDFGDIEEDASLDKIISLVSASDPYFPATYEMAMNLIAQSFQHTSFARNTGFKDPLGSRPQKDEYDNQEWDEDDNN